MAKTPLNDPNNPRSTDPYAAGRHDEPKKKSSILPIVIGLLVLAVLAYFLFGMLSADEEVVTTEPVAETEIDDTAVVPEAVVVDPVEPEVDVEPEADVVVVPETETDAAVIETDEAPADVTEETVTVEIIEPDEATTEPLEGVETTTVPLQTPETAPAN